MGVRDRKAGTTSVWVCDPAILLAIDTFNAKHMRCTPTRRFERGSILYFVAILSVTEVQGPSRFHITMYVIKRHGFLALTLVPLTFQGMTT